MKARIKNKHTGEVRIEAINGFCWEMLLLNLFGLGFVWAIVKGNYSKAIKLVIFTILTFGIYFIVQLFCFNKDNWDRLQVLGWQLDN